MKKAMIALCILTTGCGIILGKYKYYLATVEPINFMEIKAFRCFETKYDFWVYAEPEMSCPDKSELDHELGYFFGFYHLPKDKFKDAVLIFTNQPIFCGIDCVNVFPERLDKEREKNKEKRDACLETGGIITDGCSSGSIITVSLYGRFGMWKSSSPALHHEFCHVWGYRENIKDPAHELMPCYNIPDINKWSGLSNVGKSF